MGLGEENKRTDDIQADVVNWDGPDDPKHPLNWPKNQKAIHIGLVTFINFTLNLAATLFAPAAQNLAVDFSVTDSTVLSLTVSIYLLGFAVGPLAVAPLSEVYGRLWIYHVCNVCFLAFLVGCAASQNIGTFLACRFLSGCFGAAPVAIGGGTIADLLPPADRGKGMAIFGTGILLGPIVGPIIGGFVAAELGWRWTLWIVVIISGISTILCFIFMRETYAPVLLAAKSRRLQKEGRDVHIITQSATTLLLRASVRPTKMLFYSPVVLGMSLFNAMVFGLIYLLFTIFPMIWRTQYGFSQGIAGLCYLGLGAGMILAITVFSTLSDRLLEKKRRSGELQPEDRLPLMIWTSAFLPAGFFWYGWSIEANTHWIIPIIGSSLIGFGGYFVVMPSQLYLVDAFGAQGAASSLAALSVLRFIFGCFLPLAGPALYDDLGLGWGNSLLGFLALAFVPIPIAFYKFGRQFRERFQVSL